MDQAHIFIDDGLDEAPEALDKIVLAVRILSRIDLLFIFLTLISVSHS